MYFKETEMKKDAITVKELIDFLEKNFKRSDRLCFFDEGGAWCELVHVPSSFIGDVKRMFNYVKDKRQHELDNPRCHKDDVEHMKEVIKDNYRLVEDHGVVIF